MCESCISDGHGLEHHWFMMVYNLWLHTNYLHYTPHTQMVGFFSACAAPWSWACCLCACACRGLVHGPAYQPSNRHIMAAMQGDWACSHSRWLWWWLQDKVRMREGQNGREPILLKQSKALGWWWCVCFFSFQQNRIPKLNHELYTYRERQRETWMNQNCAFIERWNVCGTNKKENTIIIIIINNHTHTRFA